MQDSQIELEKPAKVYQLNALNEKMVAMDKKLDMVLLQTSNVVTPKQLEELKKEMKDYTDNTATLIYKEFRPFQGNMKKFLWLVGGGILAIVSQIIVIYSKIGK